LVAVFCRLRREPVLPADLSTHRIVASARSTEVARGILGDRDAGLTQSRSRDLTRSPLVKDAAYVGWLALFRLFAAAFLTGGLSIFVTHWSNLPPALWVVVGDGVSMGGI
jgi:hypothetical protein